MATRRSVLVKVENQWKKLRQSIQPYLNFDYDRCLNLIKVAGGIWPTADAEPWKRICLTLYCLLGFYQFIMAIAKVVFSILDADDVVGLCASTSFLVAQIAIYAKVYTLGHYDEAVRQSKAFVNSKLSNSGDPEYDAKVRRDLTRMVGKVTLTIFVLVCCNQVLLLIPSSARDRLFDIPTQFNKLGDTVARLLKAAFLLTLVIFWRFRHFYTSLEIMFLLMGLKNELVIVARGYEAIAKSGGTHIFDDQNSLSKLRNLKLMLGTIVAQHVEVMRNLHLLQPLVSYVYGNTYYSVMILVSLGVFVVIRSGLSYISFLFAATSAFYLMECFIWCRMIDLIHETVELIAGSIVQVGFRLQHSVDNHREYIEMQTSIIIVQLNASSRTWFSCGGVFPISVESFGNLCMIVFKLAMFLLNFD